MAKRKDHKGRVLQQGEYQRKNGTYEYRYSEYGNRRSVYAPTLRELRQLEEDIAMREEEFRPNANMTFAQLYERWKQCKIGIKPSTMHGYELTVKKHLLGEYGIGNRKICEIRKSDMRLFFIGLQRRTGMSVKTVGGVHMLAQQILELAVDDGLLQRNPAKGAMSDLYAQDRLISSEQDKKRDKVLTPLEQVAFFGFLPKTKHACLYNLFRFLLLTGLRIGETIALQWDDVDLISRTIVVKRNAIYYDNGDGGQSNHITSPKNRKTRVVPLCDEAVSVLRSEREKGMQCTQTVDGLHNFVFLNKHGRAWIATSIDRHLRECIDEYNAEHSAKLPKIGCHWFRHTFATRMFEANVNPRTVQEILGHSDQRMTMNVYTSVSNDVMLNGVSTMQLYLNRIENTM